MRIKRILFPVLALLLLCTVAVSALADGEASDAQAASAGQDNPALTPVFRPLSHASAEDLGRFLWAKDLPGGCTAADCAAFLRGEADKALTDAVSGRLLDASAENMSRALLRLSAGYPVYGGLSFSECSELPMLTDGYVLDLGGTYNLHGYVTSDAPITSVSTTVTHGTHNGTLYPVIRVIDFLPEDNVTCYDINRAPAGAKKSLNDLSSFAKLRYGEQTIVITATTTEQTEPVELVRATFTLEKQLWMQLTSNDFSDNYENALTFFSDDPSRFLFRYQWLGGRRIRIDPEWRAVYQVRNRWGSIHRDAEPYFLRAQQYIDTEYLRISDGGRRDTGVIPLAKLVMKNDGTSIARFVSSRKYVSHHSLGTVVDLNTNLSVNSQRNKNKYLIYDAVANHLTYNGIQTGEDGVRYYDFTYDGSYRGAPEDMPPAIVNYLLYELAFYRAGFRWGFYFDTADPMHYTLTESQYEYFEEGPFALRKVYEYIAE